jgi:pyruvate dehydrogenase E2 component (dihydrolipoamide acetyltransferase)
VTAKELPVSRHGVRIAKSIPLVSARRALAENMLKSHTQAPSVSVLVEWEIDGLVDTYQRLSRWTDAAPNRPKITYTHLMVKAVALALRQHALLNSTVVRDEIQVLDEVNVGVAVALDDGGLVVPVIRDADRKSIEQIAEEGAALIRKARAGALQLGDVRGGTFTLTNIGVVPESRWQTPILTPGQCGILAVGAVRQTAVVRAGHLAVGHALPASLTFDHRIVNGLPAALFLNTVAANCNGAALLETVARDEVGS